MTKMGQIDAGNRPQFGAQLFGGEPRARKMPPPIFCYYFEIANWTAIWLLSMLSVLSVLFVLSVAPVAIRQLVPCYYVAFGFHYATISSPAGKGKANHDWEPPHDDLPDQNLLGVSHVGRFWKYSFGHGAFPWGRKPNFCRSYCFSVGAKSLCGSGSTLSPGPAAKDANLM